MKQIFFIAIILCLNSCREDSTKYYDAGIIKADAKDYKNAIIAFTKVVELTPNYAPAYFNRAILLVEIKDYKNAILDYDKTAELNSKYHQVYLLRGVAKQKSGDKEGACMDFELAKVLGDPLAKECMKTYCKNYKPIF
jgi:tetratricopeptide (TPR) repeat protein